MFKAAFSGVSVNNIEDAKKFYTEILGLKLKDDNMGLTILLPGGAELFIYEKEDHQPATFTILNFVVEDIDKAYDELTKRGVTFNRYDLGAAMKQDDKSILRGRAAKMGPDIAWFTDPAGNILAILQA
jgi:predicted enzyme related to lactoylglutathione lyase